MTTDTTPDETDEPTPDTEPEVTPEPTPEPAPEPAPAPEAEALKVSLEFASKRYGATLYVGALEKHGPAEFARQAAEMVERTIVTHLNAMPMLEEEITP